MTLSVRSKDSMRVRGRANVFMRDFNEVIHWRNKIKENLYTGKKFPDLVYKTSDWPFLFEEFHFWLSEHAWPILKAAASYQKDEFVLVALFDRKSLLKSFYKKFGYVYWVKVPVQCTEDDFLNILTQEAVGELGSDILTLASKVIFTSSSLKWMVYAERSVELGLLAGEHLDQLIQRTDQIKRMNAMKDVFNIIRPAFYIEKDYLDFKKKMQENYQLCNL